MDDTSLEERQKAWERRFLSHSELKNKGLHKDMEHRCVHCGVDTTFGSGSFVNRIPADRTLECGTTIVGFVCGTCQSPPTCEECGGEAEDLDWRCASCNAEQGIFR